jgi:hypothetical protein
LLPAGLPKSLLNWHSKTVAVIGCDVARFGFPEGEGFGMVLSWRSKLTLVF